MRNKSDIERERERERERAILAAAAVSEQYSEGKDTGGAAGAATLRWAVDRSANAGGSKTAEEHYLLVAATRSTSRSGNKSEAVFWRGVAVVRPVLGCQPSRGAIPADGAASQRKAGGWRAGGGRAGRGWDGAAETENVTITAARSANWSGRQVTI